MSNHVPVRSDGERCKTYFLEKAETNYNHERLDQYHCACQNMYLSDQMEKGARPTAQASLKAETDIITQVLEQEL